MKAEPLRILFIDDDEDDYVITRDLLTEFKGLRCELQWVASYDAALEAVGRNEHDVCLLDYSLGKHSGLELLREALMNGCQAPIILLTGLGDYEVDIEAMKAGAADYLVKGQIDAAMLERSIRYAIERKQAEETLRAAEQRFRLISETSPIGVFETNKDGTCNYTNTKFQEIIGVSFSEIFDISWFELIHPSQKESVWKEWSDAMNNLKSFSKECRINTFKGEELWVHLRSSPMVSESGVTFTRDRKSVV